MKYDEALKKVSEYGQEHVLEFYEELSESEKAALLGQIEQTDFSVLEKANEGEKELKRGVITPIPAMKLSEIEEKKEVFTAKGIELIRAGKVGAVLLAGGMGTRLGSDDPKGMYNIGLTKEVYIFERLIRNLMDVVEQTGTFIHLFVMTSEKNHEKTVSFLKEKKYFGYDEAYVTFFMQDMAPASDYNGKVYMENKGLMSASPNGNGGWFSSMKRGGVLDIVHKAGIEYLNIFAVDNVLQRIADPCFVGATALNECAVGAKVIKKAAPDEKVGVMCLEDGRPSIVEYYELTTELMEAKDASGEPAYNYGVILNYLFRVADLEEIVSKEMPLHIVEKKIPYMNEAGETVKPEKVNGYKYESLVLDMIHMLDSCLVFEVVREKEFAPIKNPTGIDSVESARELLKRNGIAL
ncbi:MAG: UTP--glucose-1-phosphate uridylyltransferase [Lachnospiraceae bacterium]|nr:UTP--glucose-1-phosphate uridylyltransferase [Lachnospiraceae bacterium]